MHANLQYYLSAWILYSVSFSWKEDAVFGEMKTRRTQKQSNFRLKAIYTPFILLVFHPFSLKAKSWNIIRGWRGKHAQKAHRWERRCKRCNWIKCYAKFTLIMMSYAFNEWTQNTTAAAAALTYFLCCVVLCIGIYLPWLVIIFIYTWFL